MLCTPFEYWGVLASIPKIQFGGNGAAKERESPLPSKAEASYHRRELTRALWVMQQGRRRGSPASSLPSILTQPRADDGSVPCRKQTLLSAELTWGRQVFAVQAGL